MNWLLSSDQFLGSFVLFEMFDLCWMYRAVPKQLRKTKLTEVKGRRVFRVPLLVSLQQTGEPLPPSILRALRHLRAECLDQVRSNRLAVRSSQETQTSVLSTRWVFSGSRG